MGGQKPRAEILTTAQKMIGRVTDERSEQPQMIEMTWWVCGEVDDDDDEHIVSMVH